LPYDKEEVKENLELEDIYTLLEYFDAEPQMFGNYIASKTICHGGDSHKLYYYENTQLFKCYTGGCDTFDIFELVQRVNEIDDLNAAIYFVVNFFNLQSKLQETDEEIFNTEDWKIFNRWNKVLDIKTNQDKVCLPEHDIKMFQHYPQPIILDWVKEGISKEICDFMDIRYNPLNGSVLIPHYDASGRLVGVRSRTLIQELEVYGKYRPSNFGKQLLNHPLAFNLYGLDKAKSNIEKTKIAVVVESEKAVLQYLSYFGTASNICVAVCGNSLSKYQLQLLLDLGVQEIVIGFDRDFHELGDEEYYKVIDRLQKIYDKYSNLVNISFLFDKEKILSYKASPLDHGAEAFLYLFRNRIIL
jgi:hypothetical protein